MADNGDGNGSARDKFLLYAALAASSGGLGWTAIGTADRFTSQDAALLRQRIEQLERSVNRIDSSGPSVGNPRFRLEIDDHEARIRAIELRVASESRKAP